jgi:hypothetical protein
MIAINQYFSQMSNLTKLVRLKCLSRPVFQTGSSIKLIRKFSWFKPAIVEPPSCSADVSRAVTKVAVTRSVFVIDPDKMTEPDEYNQSSDTIIDLFTNTQLRQICPERWKTDFNARRLYTMFYVKYHLYDTDPALKIMAQDINIYNDNHRNLGYYLTHLLQTHTTIAEQREIMNHTLKDYDNIQPRRRIN